MRKFRILLLALVGLLLISCSNTASNTPQATAQEFLDALQEVNVEQFNSLTVPEDRISEEELQIQTQEIADVQLIKELVNTLFKDGFKVGEATIEDETATVPVTWKAPDMSALIGMIIGKSFEMMFNPEFQGLSEQEQTDIIIGEIQSAAGDLELKEYSSPLNLRQIDDQWFVEGLENKNSQFFQAMFPDMEGLLPNFGQ